MLTVLVADDNADIRTLVTFRLEQAGYRVIEAPDGESALSLIQAERPDAAVLDVTMPGLSGTEVCRQLREDVALAHTPVLLLSACAMEREVEAGLASGADDYLTKPFNARELIARVESIIRRVTGMTAARSAGLFATAATRAAYGSRPRVEAELVQSVI